MAAKQLHRAENFTLLPNGRMYSFYKFGITIYAPEGAVKQPTPLMIGIDRDPDNGPPGFIREKSSFCGEKVTLQSPDGVILQFDKPIYISVLHNYSFVFTSKVASLPKLYCRQDGPTSDWKEDCGFMSEKNVTVMATKSHCEFCLVWHATYFGERHKEELVDDCYLPSYEMNILVYGEYHPCGKNLNMRVYVVKASQPRIQDIDEWETNTGHFMGQGTLFMKPNSLPVSIRVTAPDGKSIIKQLRYSDVSDEWGNLVGLGSHATFTIMLNDSLSDDMVNINVLAHQNCCYRVVHISDPKSIYMMCNLSVLKCENLKGGDRIFGIIHDLLSPYGYEPRFTKDELENVKGDLSSGELSKLTEGFNIHDFSNVSHTSERKSAIVDWLFMSGYLHDCCQKLFGQRPRVW